MWSANHFSISSCFPCFSGSRFFRVQVFQDPDPGSESRIQGPGPGFRSSREKDKTNNFSPFLFERPFDHRKELLKNSQFHFKGFLFKFTSSGSFNVVRRKSRNHTEIRNLSEAYLEPSQRSMTEPFRVNS